MKTNQVVKIGIFDTVFPKFSSYLNTKEKIIEYLSNKKLPIGQRAVMLADYLLKYSKKFDDASFILTDELSVILRNGTTTGLQGLINRSEIDIAIQPFAMTLEKTDTSDFTYPFKLYPYTFMTRKPEYMPQMFDIFHAFSTPIWIAIILLLIVMLLIYYATLKWKYSFDKIFLHVFAICLKQCSILSPSSMAENLLVYSLVVGAMFLTLFYESTVLSFLSILPITKINDMSQLATAVASGKYHCIAYQAMGIHRMLLRSKREDFRIIGKDLQHNKLNDDDLFDFLYYGKSEKNLAFLANTELIEMYKGGAKFVSEDRFFEKMAAMMIRKNFCCKKLIETFVHKLMASGLYFKDNSDAAFLHRLKPLLYLTEEQISKRKLTLIHFAPAFILLLAGYVISFLAFIGELLLNRHMVVKCLKANKKRKKIITYNEVSV